MAMTVGRRPTWSERDAGLVFALRRSTYGSYRARLCELGSDDLDAVVPNAAAARKSYTG